MTRKVDHPAGEPDDARLDKLIAELEDVECICAMHVSQAFNQPLDKDWSNASTAAAHAADALVTMRAEIKRLRAAPGAPTLPAFEELLDDYGAETACADSSPDAEYTNKVIAEARKKVVDAFKARVPSALVPDYEMNEIHKLKQRISRLRKALRHVLNLQTEAAAKLRAQAQERK